MTTVTSSRNSGGFRGYTNEQKTLRAKLAHLLKWTRDLKTSIMKQSCKVLQSNTNQETLNQIHDELDDYKRKFDRELGRIHDICDALGTPQIDNNTENLRDEILEALRRSPTYSSLEQHIYDDDKRPRIRVRPRDKIHPGQKKISRIISDPIKRKASQPIKIQVIDTTTIPGAKRRSQIDAFKRSRSFTNVEHTETQLGMDYIEEDESDLSWKPFGPKKPINNTADKEQSKPIEKPTTSLSNDNDNSSDEEFDVAWQRREKQKARKEATSAPPPVEKPPEKRSVRFSSSIDKQTDLIELDFDETTQDGLQHTTDQNNNNKQQAEIVELDDDDDETTETQSQIITINNQDNESQIIDDSDDDEIIALNDDEIPKTSTISRRKSPWTTSDIQITSGNSQSQTLHNPYRVGIADPSLRSVFLPPPPSSLPPSSSSSNSQSNTGNRRTQGGNNRRTNNNRARR